MSGDVNIRITARDEASQTIKAIAAEAERFNAVVVRSMATAFGTAAFTDLVKSSVDYAASLDDISKRTAFSVEALSAMHNVAELSGTGLNQVAATLQHLTTNMDKAAQGQKTFAENFAALGIAVTNSKGKLRESSDVFHDLAKVVASLESPSERLIAAQMALGESGGNMVPVLIDLAERGRVAGSVTAEQASQASALNKALVEMRQTTRDAGQSFSMDLIPALAAVADVGQGAMFGIGQVGRSLAVVIKDIETAAKVTAYAFGAGFTKEGQDAIKRALDERARFVDAANDDLEERASRYQSVMGKVLNPRPGVYGDSSLPDRPKTNKDERGRAEKESKPIDVFGSGSYITRDKETARVIPGGHFKFLHLWPGQIPPVGDDRTGEFYSLAGPFARREAASLSR